MAYDIDGHLKPESRLKINNLIIPSNSGSRDFARCPSCIDQPRLQVQTNPDGNRIGICVKGCGQTFELDKTINQETGGTMLAPKRYVARFGSAQATKSLIMSQGSTKSKRKQIGSKNDELDKETLDDMAKMGINLS